MSKLSPNNIWPSVCTITRPILSDNTYKPTHFIRERNIYSRLAYAGTRKWCWFKNRFWLKWKLMDSRCNLSLFTIRSFVRLSLFFFSFQHLIHSIFVFIILFFVFFCVSYFIDGDWDSQLVNGISVILMNIFGCIGSNMYSTNGINGICGCTAGNQFNLGEYEYFSLIVYANFVGFQSVVDILFIYVYLLPSICILIDQCQWKVIYFFL